MSGAVLEAVAVVAGLQDVAMMREPVQQCGGHLRIAEHVGLLGEAEVGGDDEAGVLVELTDEMEQQRTAGLAEG